MALNALNEARDNDIANMVRIRRSSMPNLSRCATCHHWRDFDDVDKYAAVNKSWHLCTWGPERAHVGPAYGCGRHENRPEQKKEASK